MTVVSRGDLAMIACSKDQRRRWRELCSAQGVPDHAMVEKALRLLGQVQGGAVMAKTTSAFTPIASPEAVQAHNVRVLAANGLPANRIAIDLSMPLRTVEGILQGRAINPSRPSAQSKLNPKTLQTAERVKALIQQYKAEKRFACGRDICKALGLGPNWLNCNIAKGRTNPAYAWAIELEKLLFDLAEFGDPSKFKGNNRPLSLRGR